MVAFNIILVALSSVFDLRIDIRLETLIGQQVSNIRLVCQHMFHSGKAPNTCTLFLITHLIKPCKNILIAASRICFCKCISYQACFLLADVPYVVLPFFWLPEETLSLRVRRDHVMYDVWEKQGFLQTTEGNVVHYGFIEKFICELGEKYNIQEIAYDRWNATQMVQNLEDDGFTMIPFGQGFRDMSPPTKELMRLVLEHRLAHGGHPVLRWNMDNAFVRTDPAGNLKIDKQKSTEKVDGAVALVMALDRAMKNQNSGGSVYDERDMIFL